MNTKPMPDSPAPKLELELTEGTTWKLDAATPESFTMIIMYRGKHCPVCKKYLKKAQDLADRYASLGVDIVAVSMDDAQRAKDAAKEWGIDAFPVAYGMSEATALEWGLYLSDSIKDEEPRRFSEPGLFLVRPDGTLHYAAINSMPFGRPDLEDMADAIEFVQKKDYPARGRVAA
ncbi:MAG: redoxin domain-containing protein [Myxococcota bacterium]|nr:redoxin domain-containing protein [Myxococcota bacterium]